MDITAVGALLLAVISSGFAVIQWAVDRHDKQAGITREEFQALKTASIELAYIRPAVTTRQSHHR